MEKEISFSYSYSAKENKEVQEIRKKYLPQGESKMDELKRFDYTVQTSGIMESFCAGISGALIFGLGLCLAMQVIGNGSFLLILGMLLVFLGTVVMIAAYPVYRKIFRKAKAKFTPRILELTNELSAEKGYSISNQQNDNNVRRCI